MSTVKTNAMRILDKKKITYQTHFYESAGAISGTEVAEQLHQDPEHVFKTLVTTGKSGLHYVFMIPVAAELDLKKAARSVKEKSVEMLKQKDLFPLTGYVHGGCSPLGMKKQFQTVAHATAPNFPTIIFSAGQIGAQLELSAMDLASVIPLSFEDIIA